jgi:hypothetical protein
MRAHTSGRVTSFVTMREMQCAGVRSYRVRCERCSAYHPRVRHIHVKRGSSDGGKNLDIKAIAGKESTGDALWRPYAPKWSNRNDFTWLNYYRSNMRYGISKFGHAVDWGKALQVGRSRVWFPVVSLEFFIDIILLAALWPWGWLSL